MPAVAWDPNETGVPCFGGSGDVMGRSLGVGSRDAARPTEVQEAGGRCVLDSRLPFFSSVPSRPQGFFPPPSSQCHASCPPSASHEGPLRRSFCRSCCLR